MSHGYIFWYKKLVKIIAGRMEMEAMQEDAGNLNQKVMLEATVELISLDSDLQSSGNSTSSNDNEGPASVLNVQRLVHRP